MTQMIDAIFDGIVFRPDTPPELSQGTRYRLIIEALPEPNAGDVWSLLAGAAGSIGAPSDWGSEHGHYLYGSVEQASLPS